MPNNDLRTKVTDLPICTDIEQLDTILGIGKDNAMYRVDSENIGGGGKWEPLSITLSAYYTCEFNQNEITDAINRGGKIHILAYDLNNHSNLVDFDFIINSTIITRVSDMDLNTQSYKTGELTNIHFDGIEDNKIIYIVGTIYFGTVSSDFTICELTLDLTSNTPSDNYAYDYEIIGAFFEPIKNIGDLSKVTTQGPTQGPS